MHSVSALFCLSSWICVVTLGVTLTTQLSTASPVNTEIVPANVTEASAQAPTPVSSPVPDPDPAPVPVPVPVPVPALAPVQFKSESRQALSSPLDRVDVDSYLKNKRAMQLQIKCVVYDGPCDIVGKEVKKHIVSGLTGTCTDCSSRLRTSVEKVANYIQENYPQAWYDAIYRFLVQPTLGSTAKPTEGNNSSSFTTTTTTTTTSTTSSPTTTTALP